MWLRFVAIVWGIVLLASLALRIRHRAPAAPFRVRNRQDLWIHATRLLIVAAYLLAWRMGSLEGRRISELAGIPAVAIRAVGASGLTLGAALLLWSEVVLGRSFSPFLGVREGQRLVVHGPYSIVRHPIYLGLLLALPGTALALDALRELLFLGLLLPATFFVAVRIEDPVLLGAFGKTYAEYRARIPALLPFPRRQRSG